MQIFWCIIGQNFPWLNVQYASGISDIYFSTRPLMLSTVLKKIVIFLKGVAPVTYSKQ